MSALDPIARGIADLAYVDEPGAPADRVAAAIVAYLWALEQLRESEGAPGFTFGPSYSAWKAHRATLPERLR